MPHVVTPEKFEVYDDVKPLSTDMTLKQIRDIQVHQRRSNLWSLAPTPNVQLPSE